MRDDDRLAAAIQQIDEANRQDPQTQRVGDHDEPRELVFCRRVYQWVEKLVDAPSEELLLAARGHTIRRWQIPRDRYPLDTIGYHAWRNDLAAFHANETEKILVGLGYPSDTIARVKALITRENWSRDPEGRALEDADCLAFLEMKLSKYRDEWDEEKAVRILRGTLRKMTPAALEFAKRLEFTAAERGLLKKAGL